MFSTVQARRKTPFSIYFFSYSDDRRKRHVVRKSRREIVSKNLKLTLNYKKLSEIKSDKYFCSISNIHSLNLALFARFLHSPDKPYTITLTLTTNPPCQQSFTLMKLKVFVIGSPASVGVATCVKRKAAVVNWDKSKTSQRYSGHWPWISLHIQDLRVLCW